MSTATARRRLRLAAALLALAAAAEAGCARAPRREPSPTVARHAELARAAGKAARRGAAAEAIALGEQALTAARAVEDADRIGARLLDLAALRRAGGDAGGARATLAELVAEPTPLPFPGARRAEACFLAALLAVDADELAEGRALAERARALCRAARCGDEGAIVNLLARIDYLVGDFPCARRRAAEARRLLGRADGEELANSWRVAADVELADGRAAEAARAYERALAIDKRLGVPDKVALDLLGRGAAARDLGRPGEARSWLGRAAAAAQAAGEEAIAAEAAALLRELGEP